MAAIATAMAMVALSAFKLGRQLPTVQTLTPSAVDKNTMPAIVTAVASNSAMMSLIKDTGHVPLISPVTPFTAPT